VIQPSLRDRPSRERRRAFADTPLAAGLAVAASVIAGFLAAHLSPLVPSGANLSDPAQAEYARNLWSKTIPTLVAVASSGPLVVLGLLPPFLRGARRVVLAVSVPALCIAGLFTGLALNAYGQAPIPVNGVVRSFQGRDIGLCGFDFQTHHYHVILSDRELGQAHSWVKPGTAVLLYVFPSGDAAYIGPPQGDWACATSGLGQ
jgi:hypothetical protein